VSPAELASIRARADAATPGPWGYLTPSGEIVATDLTTVATCLHTPDGLWIAHARADVETLLDELERLQHAAARLRAALELTTRCEHGSGLDCPDCEPVSPLVRQALAGTAGQAVAAELAAAREVVELARCHADGHTPYPLPGLSASLADYDQTIAKTAAKAGVGEA